MSKNFSPRFELSKLALPKILLMATTARSLPDSGLVVTGTEVWLEEGAEEDFEEEGAEEEHKEEEEEVVVTLTEDRRVTHRDISSMSETKGEYTKRISCRKGNKGNLHR